MRVLIITGDGGEGYEAWYARHRFQEAGHDVVVAAPAKRRLHLVMHDFEPGWDTYIERQGYGMTADMPIDEVDANQFDVLLIIGGRAPEYLRHNGRLLAIVRDFHQKQKWLFAICHGIQVLNTAGVTKGKRVTCYEHVRSEAEAAGGTFCTEQAVRDGHIVTAQTWESHPEFYREIFACLNQASLSTVG